MKSKFYRVTCKCGHVGKKHFIRIDFPVNADSMKEASLIARQIPRVKHDHKDAILECKEIDYEEYLILQMINQQDPYLQCSNKQEQRNIANLSLRLEPEQKYLLPKKQKTRCVKYKIKRQAIIEEETKNYWLNEVILYESFAY